MGTHISGTFARDTRVDFLDPISVLGQEDDALGESDPQRHALVLGDDDDQFVIAGTVAELQQLAERIRARLNGRPSHRNDAE